MVLIRTSGPSLQLGKKGRKFMLSLYDTRDQGMLQRVKTALWPQAVWDIVVMRSRECFFRLRRNPKPAASIARFVHIQQIRASVINTLLPLPDSGAGGL